MTTPPTPPTPSSCPLCGRIDGHDHIFNRTTGHFDNLAAESRTKPTEKKYWIALLESAVVPGLGSAYAGNWISGVGYSLLFGLALWAGTSSAWGIGLAAATWTMSLLDAYEEVRTVNRGYKHVPSYQAGFRTGKSLYSPAPASKPPMTALPPTAAETQTSKATTTKETP